MNKIKSLLIGIASFCSVIALSGCETVQHTVDGSIKSLENILQVDDTGKVAHSAMYEGIYYCRQGRTDLSLEVDINGRHAQAVFNFRVNRNTYGAYTMTGHYDKFKNQLILEGKNWIRQPANYALVGLDGILTQDLSRFSGQVVGSGCSSFTLQQVSGSK